MLRGVGVALALPWLESLPRAAARAEAARRFPKRLAVLFMGNGINGAHWWARGRGTAMTLSRSLQPLEPLKHKINVISGLFNQPGVGIGIHPAQTGSLLSGTPLASGSIARAGITVDQVLADRIGRETPHASLVMACEPPAAGTHDTGFSMTYSSHLSWRDAGSPVPNELSPASVFERVFDQRTSLRRQRVVDSVRESAASLRRAVSASDRLRLDGYLASVRDVETRVDRARTGSPDLRERMRLMCDLIALAFAGDRTRVATLLLARDLSSLSYPFLDVRGDHHSASHDDLSDGYERIVRFHVSQLAYLAGRLDSVSEGDGTVLDRCCLLWLSNMWSGWKHDNLQLPVVTVGGLGGAFETGRAIDYRCAGDDNRRLCSLYLSIMDAMGVALDRFGDADRRLGGL
jgi:hypothetical protein